MLKRIRQLPENLRGVVELQKSEAEGKLTTIARNADEFLSKKKGVKRELLTYLHTIKPVVEMFRACPTDAFRQLEERDRKKFSHEVKELAEHPIHDFKHIVEVIKCVNEILEKMLFKTKFLGAEEKPHGHH